MLLIYGVYMINMQKILVLGSMWVSIDMQKTQNPNVSQQNFQEANDTSSLKAGKKTSPSPKSPGVVINQLPERRHKVMQKYNK